MELGVARMEKGGGETGDAGDGGLEKRMRGEWTFYWIGLSVAFKLLLARFFSSFFLRGQKEEVQLMRLSRSWSVKVSRGQDMGLKGAVNVKDQMFALCETPGPLSFSLLIRLCGASFN